MPVQPDWAEQVIAESGDSTKDTVSAQLHRYAGKKKKKTHTHSAESRGSNLVSVSFRAQSVCVCVCEPMLVGNDGGVSEKERLTTQQ